MTLEGFVQAVGTAIGQSRDLFGLNAYAGLGVMPMSGPSPPLASAITGSGSAALASSKQSNVLGGHVSALAVQDRTANSGLESALAAQGAARGQIDSVIGAALGDITGLAGATLTPAGQRALVKALSRRLEQTWQTLIDGNACACTHAASSAQVASTLNGLGNLPVAGLGAGSPIATTSPMATMAPMAAMSTMPMMAANQAALCNAQAQQNQQQQQQSANNSDNQFANRTNPIGNKIARRIDTAVNRALKQIGVPYSWGGGGTNGPTFGIAQGAHTRGFDCSGLVRYAFWPIVHLPRTADVQMDRGQIVAPTRGNVRAGDLIFSNFSGGDAGHVQLAISKTHLVEAPHTGAHVRIRPIPFGSHMVVKRLDVLR